MIDPSHSRTARSSKTRARSQTREEILKLREEALQLQQENFALREQIKKLHEEKNGRTNLELFENVYWLRSNSEWVGPFCPRCYSEHHRLATLLDGARFVGKTRWICPVCNRVFDCEA